MYSRDEFMESFNSGLEVIENASNDDMSVHLFGTTAVVTGFLTITGKGTDGQFNRKYRFTDTWLNVNSEWQIIAAQDYLMP